MQNLFNYSSVFRGQSLHVEYEADPLLGRSPYVSITIPTASDGRGVHDQAVPSMTIHY